MYTVTQGTSYRCRKIQPIFAMNNRIMELDLVKHVSNMQYSTVVGIEHQSDKLLDIPAELENCVLTEYASHGIDA